MPRRDNLAFKASGNATLKYLPCLVRKAGSNEIINVQQFDQVEKYIIGKYDIEILCMPRISVKDVDIQQSHTTIGGDTDAGDRGDPDHNQRIWQRLC